MLGVFLDCSPFLLDGAGFFAEPRDYQIGWSG